MQTLTQEQVDKFYELESSVDFLLNEQEDLVCYDDYMEKYLDDVLISPDGAYPDCLITGGSCSGCGGG